MQFNSLAILLQTERALRGLTVDDVANRLGLSTKEYKLLEAGDKRFCFKCPTITLIADFCNLDRARVVSMVSTMHEHCKQ